MKYLLTLLCLVIASPALSADDTDYTATFREKGYKYCAAAMNRISNWLIDQDGQVLNQWNIASPDEHMGNMLGSKLFSSGNSIMNLNGVKTVDGGCDLAFTLVLPVEKSCASLRESAFKDWKYYVDIQGVPIYEDPTSGNVSAILQTVGSGCVITKVGVFFFSKDALKDFKASPETSKSGP